MRLYSLALAISCILMTSGAHAKVFRNAYVSFELPDAWKCTLEHTEWVCRSESEKDSKEAIIILTAKEVGPTDSFDSYTSHLNTPQNLQTKTGVLPSKIIYAPKQAKINDQVWIDGLHMGSEVQNYFTRYLATIKDRIAILVTLSAHKNFYTKYSQDFFKAVMSLRVIATKNLLSSPDATTLRPGSETLGPGSVSAAMPTDLAQPEDGSVEGGAAGNKMTKSLLLAIALVLAGVAGFIFLKMRKG